MSGPVDPDHIDLSRVVRSKRPGQFKRAFQSKYRRRLLPGLANYVVGLSGLDLTAPFVSLFGVELPSPN